MTVVYSLKKDEKVFKKTKPNYTFEFVSPTNARVIHWAERVVIVGSHPAIEKMYAGILSVKIIKVKKDEPK